MQTPGICCFSLLASSHSSQEISIFVEGMATTRKIIHVDMDAFFASVEQRDNPSLRGKPVVVGGRPEKRGAIAAASYEARKFGIRSAMPSRLAAKRCPNLIFVSPQMEKYKQVSAQIRDIFGRFTDLVEPVSLDEAYLDVSVNFCNQPSAMEIARQIKRCILEETELTASAGVSNNKFLAKMASGIDKPNGLFLIRPEDAQEFVQGLPIHKFHGIGKATSQKMHQLGIYTGADLGEWLESDLVEQFGKTGRYFFKIAQGIDDRLVNPNRIRKSVGAERSFDPDLNDESEMRSHLFKLAQQLEQRLIAADQQGHTLTLKIKYSNYQQITRSRTIADEFQSTGDIYKVAKDLFESHRDPRQEVRLLGIAVAGFKPQASESFRQLEFFDGVGT